MKRYTYSLIIITVLALLGSVAPIVRAAQTNTPQLVIAEVLPEGLNDDGSANGTREFIEIFNPSDATVSLEGIRLEYLSAAHDGTGAPTRLLASLSGNITAHTHKLISSQGYLDAADFYFGDMAATPSGLLALSGGHVRLLDAHNTTLDLVGWGSGKKINHWWLAPVMQAGMSIQRLLPDNSGFIEDWLAYAAPSKVITPGTYAGVAPGSDPAADPVLNDLPACKDLYISEILPNSTGADAGREFIELYNPTSDAIPLKGCGLRLGTSEKVFALPAEELVAGGFRVFYDSETGITLPNATAQPVWLIAGSQELSQVQYPDNLSDDVSWALIDAAWQTTNQPTPGNGNAADAIVIKPVTTSVVGTLEPCPAGKERNPETNRCRAARTTVAACSMGKERSAETGRCRTIHAIATSPTPCKTGQIRNAQTNRCRAVAAAVSNTTTCATGKERNLETNRCRKIAGSASKQFASIQDVSAPTTAVHYRWIIAGAAVSGAIGYAIYEWRHDIANILYRWRSRMQRPKVRK